MHSMVLAIAVLLGYAVVLLCCAGGSLIAGVLARSRHRQMLAEIDSTRFRDLENRFNQAFVVSVTLAAFGLSLLAMAPMLAGELKVWP